LAVLCQSPGQDSPQAGGKRDQHQLVPTAKALAEQREVQMNANGAKWDRV